MTAPVSSSAAEDSRELLVSLIERATTAGASAADAVLADQVSVGVTQRLGEREELERAEGREIGLRVFVGQRQAIVSSTDASARTVGELVERALAMAKSAPEDPYCGLADPAALATAPPDLELAEDYEADAESLYGIAAEAEDAARSVAGVSNSNGAGVSWSRTTQSLVTSGGFSGSSASSSISCYASMVAGQGTAMETDYAFSRARFLGDLRSPAEIGREAGERTVRRLNPRKVDSGAMSVVYEPRAANSMLQHLAQAVSGPAIARKTSFLRDRMLEQVFADGITVVDDPHRRRGLGSRPFDGEGVATRPVSVIDRGVLGTWMLSSDSARQLNLPSTGHAARGASSAPGPAPSNLYIKPGELTPDELTADIERGVWITDLIGFGVDMVTGDYSRGAAGFWIENGERTTPISEFTVAGNLKAMFRGMTAANDLAFRYRADSPTLRIEGMTVAGK